MLYDLLSIDRTDTALLYEQLYENVKKAIRSGALKKGGADGTDRPSLTETPQPKAFTRVESTFAIEP